MRVVSGTTDLSQKSRGGTPEMAVMVYSAGLGTEAGGASVLGSAAIDGCVFGRDSKASRASRDGQGGQRVLGRVVKPAKGGEEEGAVIPWSVRLGISRQQALRVRMAR